MSCFHPNAILIRNNPIKKHGKWIKSHFLGKYDVEVAKSFENSVMFKYQAVPCGQCIGCRLERARQGAIRSVHEAQMHENNCFITLTYNEDCVPRLPDGQLTLYQKHMADFNKRFRERIKVPIKNIYTGEYGDEFDRPHFHQLTFGYDFPDKYLWRTRSGHRFYRSPLLESLWKFGNCEIGDITFESAGYVCRYVTKKILGDIAEEHYDGRRPEFIVYSNGIAKEWFEKFKDDIYPNDEIVLRGLKMKPPRYYDRLFDIEDPAQMRKIKLEREQRALTHADNNTPERLSVRETVQLARFKQLKRGYENESFSS